MRTLTTLALTAAGTRTPMPPGLNTYGTHHPGANHPARCRRAGGCRGAGALVRYDGGRLERPGAKLIRAVKAWASEWVVVDGDFSDFPEVMWVGASEWVEVGEMCQNLTRAYDLHLHHAGLI